MGRDEEERGAEQPEDDPAGPGEQEEGDGRHRDDAVLLGQADLVAWTRFRGGINIADKLLENRGLKIEKFMWSALVGSSSSCFS